MSFSVFSLFAWEFYSIHIWNTIFICFYCFLLKYKRQGNIISNGIMASSFCGPVIKRQEDVVFVYVCREDFYSQQFVPLQFPFMLFGWWYLPFAVISSLSSLSASSRPQPQPPSFVGFHFPAHIGNEKQFYIKGDLRKADISFRSLSEVSLSPSGKTNLMTVNFLSIPHFDLIFSFNRN